VSSPATPGQTVGPFFAFGLEYPGDAALVPLDHPDAVTLHGRVLDGAGEAVPDALVELWQVGPDGRVVQRAGSLRRDVDTFTGWGRCGTNPDGRYAFTTLVPGAPFFALTVFARGLLDRLFTRAYLPDAADDPFLQSVGDRRGALLATRDEGGFVFDIRLQGDHETVFLDHPRD
jgi:protocatechuate 3,4-dioxygenase alpha subunit